MRVVVVTARLPTGSGETFLVPELIEMQRVGLELLVVPLRIVRKSPRPNTAPYPALCEPLFSVKVMLGAASEFRRNPKQAIALVTRLLWISKGSIRWRTLAALPKIFWLAGTVRKRQAAHIHAYWASTVATLAMGASGLSGVPWSFTAHRYDIVEDGFLDKKSESAKFVRSISLAGISLAQARSRELFCERARVLHLGVKVPDIVRVAEGGEFVVISAAAFLPVKGHDVLIDGFARFVTAWPDARLILAGDGPLRGRITELVDSKGLGNKVIFRGAIPQAELLSLYARGRVHAAVLASLDHGAGLREGIPASLMEAMAFGVPVVATDTGGIPELLGDGAGIVIPQGDPVALSWALSHLAGGRDVALRIGRAGREKVSKAFNAKTTARKLTEWICDPN